MRDFSLTEMALDLLTINEEIHMHFKNPMTTRIKDFELYTFEQSWGNTSGGFEGIGGSAMTNQRTYVLIPTFDENELCIVYFGRRYAYSTPYSKIFMEDVLNQKIAGLSTKSKYSVKEKIGD